MGFLGPLLVVKARITGDSGQRVRERALRPLLLFEASVAGFVRGLTDDGISTYSMYHLVCSMWYMMYGAPAL